MNQIQQQAATNQSLFNRAKDMANGKTDSELSQIARNICASKGIDYEAALEAFKKQWGMM